MARIRTRVRLSHLLVTLTDGRTIPLPYQDILLGRYAKFEISEAARAANPDLPPKVPVPDRSLPFLLERLIRRSCRRHAWNHGQLVSVRCENPCANQWFFYLATAFLISVAVHVAVWGTLPCLGGSRGRTTVVRPLEGMRRAPPVAFLAGWAAACVGLSVAWGRVFGFNPLSRDYVRSLNVGHDGVEAVYANGKLVYRPWSDRIAPRRRHPWRLAFGGERPIEIVCMPRPPGGAVMQFLDPLATTRVPVLGSRQRWRKRALRSLLWQVPMLVLGLAVMAWRTRVVPHLHGGLAGYLAWVCIWMLAAGLTHWVHFIWSGARGRRFGRFVRRASGML